MRVYLDSSALIKRVIAEPDSSFLIEAVDDYHRQRAALVTSSLTWIEVSRALRSLANASLVDVLDDADDALSGVLEHPVAPEVVAPARRANPHILPSLDAIHLASALILDTDVVLTYDNRLAQPALATVCGW